MLDYGHGTELGRDHRRRGLDTWVRKIPLEEETAAHSSILAWKIPWTEQSGGLQLGGCMRSLTCLSTHAHDTVMEQGVVFSLRACLAQGLTNSLRKSFSLLFCNHTLFYPSLLRPLYFS